MKLTIIEKKTLAVCGLEEHVQIAALKAASKPPLRPLRMLNKAIATDPLPTGCDGEQVRVITTLGFSSP